MPRIRNLSWVPTLHALQLEELLASRADEVNGRRIGLRLCQMARIAGWTVHLARTPLLAEHTSNLRAGFVRRRELYRVLEVHRDGFIAVKGQREGSAICTVSVRSSSMPVWKRN